MRGWLRKKRQKSKIRWKDVVNIEIIKHCNSVNGKLGRKMSRSAGKGSPKLSPGFQG